MRGMTELGSFVLLDKAADFVIRRVALCALNIPIAKAQAPELISLFAAQ
jgi:hypothetical protein